MICITPVSKLDFQGISCADVADICVKALHDTTARNKSFDVSKPCLVSRLNFDPK